MSRRDVQNLALILLAAAVWYAYVLLVYWPE
jgi:hypothetical protein